MCACIAQPRSGLAPMIPTRIVCDPFLRMAMTASDATDSCDTLLCHDFLLLLFTFTSPGWYSCRHSILATSISSHETQNVYHLKICHEHYATLTTVFPKFSPVKMPLKAVGTCSTPSTMCILNFMLPSLSHPPRCSCIFPSRGSQGVLRSDCLVMSMPTLPWTFYNELRH